MEANSKKKELNYLKVAVPGFWKLGLKRMDNIFRILNHIAESYGKLFS